MNAQNATATLATTTPASSSIEVVVIGSAGVWAKGPTLDAAFANAKKFSGTLGKEVVIVVSPVALETWVDEVGALRWKGNLDTRPRYVLCEGKNGTTVWWPNRRTSAMLARYAAVVPAVEAKLAALAAEKART